VTPGRPISLSTTAMWRSVTGGNGLGSFAPRLPVSKVCTSNGTCWRRLACLSSIELELSTMNKISTLSIFVAFTCSVTPDTKHGLMGANDRSRQALTQSVMITLAAQ
jgi:hypothetical protein